MDELDLRGTKILKIDTEGSEIPILQSIGERVQDIDFILIEYHSEADRRAIDALLRGHTLFGARVARPGLGTLKYLHPRWLSRAHQLHSATVGLDRERR
jgi:hypothetical protein